MSANYIVSYSRKFLKALKKLSAIEHKQVIKTIRLLEDDPFYPALRSKKIKGNPGLYEISVNMNLRILWSYKNGRVVVLLDVGGHDILNDY